MRSIKFRAWDTKRKEWYNEGNEYGLTFYGFHLFGECTVVNGLKLGDLQYLEIEQYVGLKDKNNKEIYEGDKVLFDHPVFSREYEVVFKEYQFTGKGFWASIFDVPGALFSQGTEYIEIIGHIHEGV